VRLRPKTSSDTIFGNSEIAVVIGLAGTTTGLAAVNVYYAVQVSA